MLGSTSSTLCKGVLHTQSSGHNVLGMTSSTLCKKVCTGSCTGSVHVHRQLHRRSGHNVLGMTSSTLCKRVCTGSCTGSVHVHRQLHWQLHQRGAPGNQCQTLNFHACRAIVQNWATPGGLLKPLVCPGTKTCVCTAPEGAWHRIAVHTHVCTRSCGAQVRHCAEQEHEHGCKRCRCSSWAAALPVSPRCPMRWPSHAPLSYLRSSSNRPSLMIARHLCHWCR